MLSFKKYDQMKLSTRLYPVVICVLIMSLVSIEALAELVPLEDEDLSEISGQAYVALDTQDVGDLSYIRASLGMEVNTQLNIDELIIGDYYRWENGAPCFSCSGNEPGLEKMPADIWIQNLTLGSIAEYSGIQMDGKYYEKGDIVPFQLLDPYVEMVSENGEVIGFRAGVHQARGTFGGDLLSLTGNFPIKVKDTASALVTAPNRPWWIALAGALLPRTPVEGQALLVTGPNESNGQVDYGTGGQLDAIRGTYFGLPDGANFTLGPIPFIGNVNFRTTNCNLHGIPTCFPISQFKSLEVGEKQPDGTYEPTGGWFLSFQKKAVEWTDPEDGTTITAPAGAYFSVPVGGVELTLDDAFHGTERKRAEFIDRGNNLF